MAKYTYLNIKTIKNILKNMPGPKVIFPKWPYDQNTKNEKYIYLE